MPTTRTSLTRGRKAKTSKAPPKPRSRVIFEEATRLDLQLEAELREAATALAEGDRSPLFNAKPIFASGRTSFEPIAGCAVPHYLHSVDDDISFSNSFEWWDREPPPGGPITNDFECEFTPALAIVVGSLMEIPGNPPLRPHDGPETLGFETIDWSDGQVVSPNEIPGIQFSVRSNRPGSDPKLRSVAGVNEPGEGAVLLVNDPEPGQQLDLEDNELRPSVWIDFAIPQRAVGIEYGYEPLPGKENQGINSQAVKLIAYDHRMQWITLADNEALQSNGFSYHEPRGGIGVGVGDLGSGLEPAKADHRIGVRDKEARIHAVELRFDYYDAQRLEEGGDPGDLTREPQAILRIWHEALPPAAVKQGTLAEIWKPEGVSDADKAELLGPEFEQILGPQTFRLPFKCTNALVIMRGFKLRFLDDEARDVRHLGAGFQGPRSFEVAPGGTINVSPEVFFDENLERRHAFLGLIYYSLLAWDKEQAELFDSQGIFGDHSEETGFASEALFEERCPHVRTTARPLDEACGPLFGALQGFIFRRDEGQTIDVMAMSVGDQVNGGLTRVVAPALAADDPKKHGIVWSIASDLEGDGSDDHARLLKGSVLTGRSLVTLGEFTLAGWSPQFGRRAAPGDPSHWAFYVDPKFNPAHDPEKPRVPPVLPNLEGDVAFLGSWQFMFEPDGKVSELEVEYRGEAYDGRTIEWQFGMGIGVEDSGVGLSDIDEGVKNARIGAGAPQFGTVVRKSRFGRPRLEAQRLEFDNAIVGRHTGQTQLGAITNVGDALAMLTELPIQLRPGDDIVLRLLWRGYWITVDLGARPLRILPLQLAPGESLLIGGRYRPGAVTARPDILYTVGAIEVRSNHGRPWSLLIAARVTEDQSTGSWQPERLRFGKLRRGQSRTLTAVLLSTGQMSLVVYGFSLEDEDQGFTINFQPGAQIDTEGVVGTVTLAASGNLGVRSTRVVANTSAGPIYLPLAGEIVRGGTRPG